MFRTFVATNVDEGMEKALRAIRETSRLPRPDQPDWVTALDGLISDRSKRMLNFRTSLEGSANVDAMSRRVQQIVYLMRLADEVMFRTLTRIQRLASVQFFLSALPQIVTPEVYESPRRKELLAILGIDINELIDPEPMSDAELEQFERLFDARLMALIMSRQFGKTTVISQCLAILSLVAPGLKINVYSTQQSQAKSMVLEARAVIAALGFDSRATYREQDCLLKVTHGDQPTTTIRGLPHNPKVRVYIYYNYLPVCKTYV